MYIHIGRAWQIYEKTKPERECRLGGRGTRRRRLRRAALAGSASGTCQFLMSEVPLYYERGTPVLPWQALRLEPARGEGGCRRNLPEGALVLCIKPTSSLPVLQIPISNYEISYE